MKTMTTEYEAARVHEEEARIAAYLGGLGLPPEYAEFHARESAREAAVLEDDPSAGVDCAEAGLARIVGEFEAWLGWLCENACNGRPSDPARLAWHLRPVLSQYPEVFLRRDNLGEAVRRAVELSARPTVPDEQRVAMPTQLIEFPAALDGAFWRGVLGRLKPLKNRPRSVDTDSASHREGTGTGPFKRRSHRTGFATLLILSSLTTAVMTIVFARLISTNGWNLLDTPLLALFAILFLWISIAFWTATFGFAIRLFEGAQARKPASEGTGDIARRSVSPPSFPRTALVMPIHNEDAARVFAGLAAMRESLQQTGHAAAFDFFILSDTTHPDVWAREEALWNAMQGDATVDSGVFYRHRADNRGHKAGNIRDFCERWGGRYAYMVVLDADSLMTGETLAEMVRRMESDRGIGILQVPSALVNRRALFARLLQFANAVYGNIFRPGFGLWSGTEGNYWGHNAIVRLDAFTRCCGLPPMPGPPPWGGEILSHDFVEAALMLRGGWKVVVALDLGGSYEECPANLIEYAKRDERWSQGNLQHLPLIAARGLNPLSRFHLAMGAMSYLASPLWALFLLLSLLQEVGLGSTGGDSIDRSTALLGTPRPMAFVPLTGALGLLLLVKVWAYLAALRRPGVAGTFGGPAKLAVSVLLETFLSILLAPILMVLHTRFVINALSGHKVKWEAQPRFEAGVGLGRAVRAHGLDVLLGLAVASVTFWHALPTFLWMLPIFTGLIVAIPFSLIVSSARMGNRLKTLGILLTPEETDPPPLLVRQQAFLAKYLVASD